MSLSCSGCGSLLADDATICDLCGLPTGPERVQDFYESEEAQDGSGVHADSPTDLPSAQSERDGVHCNQCGWKNPTEARFCSSCGAKLQVIQGAVPTRSGDGQTKPEVKGQKASGRSRKAPPATVRKESLPEDTGGLEPGAGRQMGIIIGAAVMVIFAVYMLFNMTSEGDPGAPVTAVAGAPSEPPLSAEFAARESDLRSEMAGLTGEARVDKQRELLTLYFTSGRFDLAGAQAEEIGRATGAETAWIDAGNFYYDWMESSIPENKAYYSRKATNAYQQALAVNPDNLDVRTDMAVAYLYDPENSMLAIQETQAVLDVDSNHVQANFNRAIMLWQISRIDEAKNQFEKVLDLVDDPEELLFQRAAEALATLNQTSADF